MIYARSFLLFTWLGFCTLNIFLWPRNKFEWMLTEPNAAAERLTFCTLPIDPDASVGASLAMAPVLATLILGVILSVRAGKIAPSLIGGLVLMALWIIRFNTMFRSC